MLVLGLGRNLHTGGPLGHPRVTKGSLPGPAPGTAHLFPIISFIHKVITLGWLVFLLLILFLRVTFTVVQGQHPCRGSA